MHRGEDEAENALWELSFLNGNSIFVDHSYEDENIPKMRYGPFLFVNQDDLMRFQNTHGPHNLLRPMASEKIRAQKVSTQWVREHMLTAFEPYNTDCIVLGEMLIPMTERGAKLIDARLELEEGMDTRTWQTLCEMWGEPAMRTMNVGLVTTMMKPGLPN